MEAMRRRSRPGRRSVDEFLPRGEQTVEPARSARSRVVATPGHAADHVCFVLGDVCFCGDLILGTRLDDRPAGCRRWLPRPPTCARWSAVAGARADAARPGPRPLDHRSGGEDRRVRRPPARPRAPAARRARGAASARARRCLATSGTTSPSRCARPPRSRCRRTSRSSPPRAGSSKPSWLTERRWRAGATRSSSPMPSGRELLDSERVVVVSSIGPRGWPHSMPMWFVRPRRRDLGLDLRQVAEGPQPGARPAGDAAGRDRGRVHRAARDPDRGRGGADPRHPSGSPSSAAELTSATRRASTRSRATPPRRCEAQAAKRVAIRFEPLRIATWDHRKLGGTY